MCLLDPDLVKMATDLKIEIFAYKQFYDSWFALGMKDTPFNILQVYGDECMRDNNYSEACDDTFNKAIYCRMVLFTSVYVNVADYEEALRCDSLSDFQDYVNRLCDRDDLFGYLTIFEKMLSTCAFVYFICLLIYEKSLIDVVNYAHIIWAMYFDKFTDKFYKEGGWNELKRIAKTYISLHNLLLLLEKERKTEQYLRQLKEASLNYCQFKKDVKYENCKDKHKDRNHIYKLWIKFHIEHFDKYARVPSSYEDSVDSFEIEMLLQQLKFIFESSYFDLNEFKTMLEEFQGTFSSNEILSSKTFDNIEKIKTREDIRLENIRNRQTTCNEFPDSRKCLETQLQSEFSTQSEKIIAYEIIQETENVKKISIEMEMQGNKSAGNIDSNSPTVCNIIPDENMILPFNTNIKTTDKSADLDSNNEIANTCFDNEKVPKCTSPGKEKRCYILLNAGHDSYSNQKKETLWNKNSPPKNLPNPINFYYESEISRSYNERESSKSPLKSKFYATNETYNDNIKQSCAFSSDQMAVSQCERNEINEKSTPKDFLAVKEVTQNSCGKINTNRELDKLREEQADRNIRNFLRMILILGDRKGNHYVRETLSCNEENHENSQVKSSKRKKRSKKSRK